LKREKIRAPAGALQENWLRGLPRQGGERLLLPFLQSGQLIETVPAFLAFQI
jgi:hypothetical protein